MIKKICNILESYALFVLNVIYDAFLYFKYSSLSYKRDRTENLSSSIIAHVHSVERAFSLKNTREVFGLELMESLHHLISQIKDKDEYRYELELFESAVFEYNSYHGIKQQSSAPSRKSCYDYIYKEHASYAGVVKSRRSIRDFGEINVSIISLLKSISMANNISPSVCNRQSCRTFVIKDPVKIANVLALQSGNAGIENIQYILVLTSAMTSFFGPSERRQPYVDGGIFLMSLLNCLHYNKIAACTLNWSVSYKKDFDVHKLLGLELANTIIGLVAVGSYPSKIIKVAASHRKPLRSIVKIIE